MTDEIVFDNFLITDDLEISKAFTADTWDIKSYEERAATSAGVSVIFLIWNYVIFYYVEFYVQSNTCDKTFIYDNFCK